jgi:hypothetical protein
MRRLATPPHLPETVGQRSADNVDPPLPVTVTPRRDRLPHEGNQIQRSATSFRVVLSMAAM